MHLATALSQPHYQGRSNSYPKAMLYLYNSIPFWLDYKSLTLTPVLFAFSKYLFLLFFLSTYTALLPEWITDLSLSHFIFHSLIFSKNTVFVHNWNNNEHILESQTPFFCHNSATSSEYVLSWYNKYVITINEKRCHEYKRKKWGHM